MKLLGIASCVTIDKCLPLKIHTSVIRKKYVIAPQQFVSWKFCCNIADAFT